MKRAFVQGFVRDLAAQVLAAPAAAETTMMDDRGQTFAFAAQGLCAVLETPHFTDVVTRLRDALDRDVEVDVTANELLLAVPVPPRVSRSEMCGTLEEARSLLRGHIALSSAAVAALQAMWPDGLTTPSRRRLIEMNDALFLELQG